MILGIGTDLCSIERIEQSLERFGERFVHRCFTETERRRAAGRVGRAAPYATRFAAKESRPATRPSSTSPSPTSTRRRRPSW